MAGAPTAAGGSGGGGIVRCRKLVHRPAVWRRERAEVGGAGGKKNIEKRHRRERSEWTAYAFLHVGGDVAGQGPVGRKQALNDDWMRRARRLTSPIRKRAHKLYAKKEDALQQFAIVSRREVY